MHQVTVSMAIMDYLPVICFGITAVLLLMDLYDKMQKGAFALFAAGTIDIFAAGLLKATWKLLYAADICGFQVLNTMFLPVQSLGFLLAGLGMILMFCAKKPAMMAAAPLLFSGKVIFILMMVLGLGSICTCLNILAVKLRKKAAVFLFIFAFLASMGMGAMASQDSGQAWVNWAEQCINCVSQGSLLWGTFILHKAGLKQLKL